MSLRCFVGMSFYCDPPDYTIIFCFLNHLVDRWLDVKPINMPGWQLEDHGLTVRREGIADAFIISSSRRPRKRRIIEADAR